jgi:hypothetical protein
MVIVLWCVNQVSTDIFERWTNWINQIDREKKLLFVDVFQNDQPGQLNAS